MCSCLADSRFSWIYIGNKDDAKNIQQLRSKKIKYILNVTPSRVNGGVPNYHERNSYFDYCRIPLLDNAVEVLSKHYHTAWQYIEKARIREDGCLLVHCQLGISRSVSIVCSYLIKFHKFTLEDSLKLIRISRQIAKPNDGFMAQLKQLDEDLRKTRNYSASLNDAKDGSDKAITTVGGNKSFVVPAKRPTIGPTMPPSLSTSSSSPYAATLLNCCSSSSSSSLANFSSLLELSSSAISCGTDFFDSRNALLPICFSSLPNAMIGPSSSVEFSVGDFSGKTLIQQNGASKAFASSSSLRLCHTLSGKATEASSPHVEAFSCLSLSSSAFSSTTTVTTIGPFASPNSLSNNVSESDVQVFEQSASSYSHSSCSSKSNFSSQINSKRKIEEVKYC